MAEHTPGPWIFSGVRSWHGDIEYQNVGPDGDPVAMVFVPSRNPRHFVEGINNGKLIASAPALQAENERLREALRPFAEAARELEDDHPDRSEIWESPAAMAIDARHLRAARTLFTKAESQS